jgi:hypothetical protein
LKLAYSAAEPDWFVKSESAMLRANFGEGTIYETNGEICIGAFQIRRGFSDSRERAGGESDVAIAGLNHSTYPFINFQRT